MQAAQPIARAVRSICGRDTAGVVLSVAIIATACFILFELLRDVDVGKVRAALQATPARAIVVAGLLIAASYVTLTFYDIFALRAIGQTHIPYRVAAFTGLLAYAIGHSLGATVLTGGAIRFRIYRAWGLTLVDVAKVAFLTGFTFWLGNAFVLGVGVACIPDAAGSVSQLPPWLNRAVALTTLALIACYLIWLIPRPRTIGRDDWAITLPSAPLTLVQIGIGATDMALAALAMNVLVSAHASVDAATLMVTFVMAALLGFASHAPGGLGALDAAMLIGLKQVEKEPLLAALVIYRALYFVLPFCVAIVALALRELWTTMKALLHS